MAEIRTKLLCNRIIIRLFYSSGNNLLVIGPFNLLAIVKLKKREKKNTTSHTNNSSTKGLKTFLGHQFELARKP